MKKTLKCRFNDNNEICIDACTLPNPDIMICYNSLLEFLPDLKLIRESDKSFVTICDMNNRNIYEFYNMELGSTQILENGDGTITVHYYFRDFS